MEKMITEDGINLVKLWFSIERDVQQERFANRRKSLLTSWKFSTVDLEAQMKWDDYTSHKEHMFAHTSSEHCPWMVVDGNNKELARLEAIRYVLSLFDYEGKADSETRVVPDASVVKAYK